MQWRSAGPPASARHRFRRRVPRRPLVDARPTDRRAASVGEPQDGMRVLPWWILTSAIAWGASATVSTASGLERRPLRSTWPVLTGLERELDWPVLGPAPARRPRPGLPSNPPPSEGRPADRHGPDRRLPRCARCLNNRRRRGLARASSRAKYPGLAAQAPRERQPELVGSGPGLNEARQAAASSNLCLCDQVGHVCLDRAG